MNKITREILLYAVNGAHLRLTLREVYALMRNFHFATFLIFALLAVFASIFSQASEVDSASIFAFILGASIYFVVYVGLLSLILLLPDWRVVKIIPSPILCFIGTIASLFLVFAFFGNNSFLSHSFASLTWKDISVYYILIVIFDAISITYVAPEALKQIRAAQNNHDILAPEVEEGTIKTAKMEIAKNRILYISAVSHHVNFITKTETLKARARIGDIIAQTTTDDGIQIHRSHWVARQGVKASSKKNGKLVLEMQDSAILTVSRGRQAEVQSWLKHANLE